MAKSVWTEDKVKFLKEHYPLKGKWWCVSALCMSESQVRSKASRLKLRARGVSEAWHDKQKQHAKIMTGRKRPDQSLIMKRLHSEGKLLKTEEQRKAIGVRIKNWIASNGHPRGALGMKHTEATKSLIRDSGILAWACKSEKQRRDIIMKAAKTKQENGTNVHQRIKTTWKAGWRDIGGIKKFYRSRWEANYARYLDWLKAKGEICEWKHEPKTFWFEKIQRGAVSYLPDFMIIETDGSETYHEVKGWMDSRSKTKIKRMAKYFPEVKLIVIDSKAYKSLERQVGSVIVGWE